MQDNGILRYGYQMAGTSTGRFTSSKPAIHNLSSKSIDPSILPCPRNRTYLRKKIEARYDIRTLLLKGKGVVRLDFATQENRVFAYLTENSAAAKDYIRNEDFHQLTAKQLGVDRPTAKVVNLAPIYGMGSSALGVRLKLPQNKADNLMNEFWANNPELLHFKKSLATCEAFSTPLYGRKMYLRGHMKINWVVQGSCAELLWEALRYLQTQKDEVQILPHFHDELVLKCLVCKEHTLELCEPIKQIKQELEDLYLFVWPGTIVKVLRLEAK